MGEKQEICLTNVNVASQQDIALLIEAAEDIQNATEANFSHMKNKKWYNRLWEIVTFSRDNIKVLAKNTASLAQMQDIILRVIVMASKESRELSQYLATHSEQMENIAKGQTALANAIAKIKYGHDERPDIKNMPVEYQYVIVSAAFKFVNQACDEPDKNSFVQQYLRNLRNCCELTLSPEISEFNFEKIDNLKEDAHKLLALIICEIGVLLDDSKKKSDAFNEVTRRIGIAPVMFEKIKDRVAEYAKIMGKEFIASCYDGNINSNYSSFAADGEWAVCPENHTRNEPCPELDQENFALPPDDTDAQFPELKRVILKYVSEMQIEKRDTENFKNMQVFIDKHNLKVVNETVIALLDTSITGTSNKKIGILFTTYAMYHKDYSENLVKIAYSNINYGKCELTAPDKKGNYTKLKIAFKKGKPFIFEGAHNIKLDSFLDMLIEVGKLAKYAPTDSPQPISAMDFSIKFPFVKYLINFMTYVNQPIIGVMRFACDIGFSDAELAKLAGYIADFKEPDANLLLQINDNAPYGSRKSLKYALISEMYNQLQFAKDSFDISAAEHEFIRKTSLLYGFSSEDIANLKVFTNMKYKIVSGQIKSKQKLQEAGNALTALASTGGISLGVVVGSAFLFRNTWWLYYIPGIGAALASIVVADQSVGKHRNHVEFKNQITDMIADEARSYTTAVNRLLGLFPGMAAEIKRLKKKRTKFFSNV